MCSKTCFRTKTSHKTCPREVDVKFCKAYGVYIVALFKDEVTGQTEGFHLANARPL